jgi:hypothetical protein
MRVVMVVMARRQHKTVDYWNFATSVNAKAGESPVGFSSHRDCG